MSIAAATIGKILWVLGVVGWYVIRYPFERRARRVRVVSGRRTAADSLGLIAALVGMAVLPGIYVATGFPRQADYPPSGWIVALGAIAFAAALAVFRISHKQLGRNWSITLEIREKHMLVASGPYALVRHPMYTSFLLMALGQALLLPNWFAGPVGLVGFAVLFFLRVDKEERMMLSNFGPEYRTYMERTKRLIPYIY
ncbi:protein-S-isoprenylcysteine O-methyltransferase [Mesorhizobium xinjiangense]|uniref:protein-S-isoprenylcysteine O-methyltransferase n=1 Tax=Mesorhizobium xinjiangense TaxID=2678685 RepID=UPI0038B23AC3